MTASKCRTTHRKALFRLHEDDPVLHDHKPNETSKAQSRTSICSAAATAVEAADSRHARVVRSGSLLMPQQYVRFATPIVDPGLLEMRCCRARSTAAGSVRRWEPPAKAVIVPRRGVRKILTLPLDFRYVSEIRLRFGDFKAILRQSPGRAWIEKILIFFPYQLGGSRWRGWDCGAAWPRLPRPSAPWC